MSFSHTKVFIWFEDREQGPFSVSDINQSVSSGLIPMDTASWTNEDKTWKPISLRIEELAEEITVPLPDIEGEMEPEESRKLGGDMIALLSFGLACFFGLGCIMLLKTGKSSEVIIETAEEAVECTVLISSDDGEGSGVIVKNDSDFYLYTNVHVASMRDFEVRDYRGKRVLISSVGETPEEMGVDLVRFKLLGKPDKALILADRNTIEEGGEVFAVGNSGGIGVLRSLPGEVLGIGPNKIEVDCEFIQGNSGGPIVNTKGELLALASFMTSNKSIWAKGTTHEIRRFGWIPSADYNWSETTDVSLAKESEAFNKCLQTWIIMETISYAKLGKGGWDEPAQWPESYDFSYDGIVNSRKPHPLLSEFKKSQTVLGKMKGKSTESEIVSVYAQFFDDCEDYAEDETVKLEKLLQSGFWGNEFSQIKSLIEEAQETFSRQNSKYKRAAKLGGSLQAAK